MFSTPTFQKLVFYTINLSNSNCVYIPNFGKCGKWALTQPGRESFIIRSSRNMSTVPYLAPTRHPILLLLDNNKDMGNKHTATTWQCYYGQEALADDGRLTLDAEVGWWETEALWGAWWSKSHSSSGQETVAWQVVEVMQWEAKQSPTTRQIRGEQDSSTGGQRQWHNKEARMDDARLAGGQQDNRKDTKYSSWAGQAAERRCKNLCCLPWWYWQSLQYWFISIYF